MYFQPVSKKAPNSWLPVAPHPPAVLGVSMNCKGDVTALAEEMGRLGNGPITQTMKLKRLSVLEGYQDQLQAL